MCSFSEALLSSSWWGSGLVSAVVHHVDGELALQSLIHSLRQHRPPTGVPSAYYRHDQPNKTKSQPRPRYLQTERDVYMKDENSSSWQVCVPFIIIYFNTKQCFWHFSPKMKALDFKRGYMPFICVFASVLFSDPLLSSLKPVIVTLV